MQNFIIFIETTDFYLKNNRNVLEKESRQLQKEVVNHVSTSSSCNVEGDSISRLNGQYIKNIFFIMISLKLLLLISL